MTETKTKQTRLPTQLSLSTKCFVKYDILGHLLQGGNILFYCYNQTEKRHWILGDFISTLLAHMYINDIEKYLQLFNNHLSITIRAAI